MACPQPHLLSGRLVYPSSSITPSRCCSCGFLSVHTSNMMSHCNILLVHPWLFHITISIFYPLASLVDLVRRHILKSYILAHLYPTLPKLLLQHYWRVGHRPPSHAIAVSCCLQSLPTCSDSLFSDCHPRQCLHFPHDIQSVSHQTLPSDVHHIFRSFPPLNPEDFKVPPCLL